MINVAAADSYGDCGVYAKVIQALDGLSSAGYTRNCMIKKISNIYNSYNKYLIRVSGKLLKFYICNNRKSKMFEHDRRRKSLKGISRANKRNIKFRCILLGL